MHVNQSKAEFTVQSSKEHNAEEIRFLSSLQLRRRKVLLIKESVITDDEDEFRGSTPNASGPGGFWIADLVAHLAIRLLKMRLLIMDKIQVSYHAAIESVS